MRKYSDSKRFKQKMALAKNAARVIFPELVKDSAAYVNAKLVGAILNGASGSDYPKPRPAGIGADGGYVGVVTSNLRRSIGINRVSEFVYVVRQVNAALAPYHDQVVNWSEQQYGLNFYDITRQLYGPKVANEIFNVLSGIAQDIDNLKKPSYRNPFPG